MTPEAIRRIAAAVLQLEDALRSEGMPLGGIVLAEPHFTAMRAQREDDFVRHTPQGEPTICGVPIIAKARSRADSE